MPPSRSPRAAVRCSMLPLALLAVAVLAVAAAAGCQDMAATPGPRPAAGHHAGHPVIGPWGLDLSALDPSVRPGDNFYLYANGNWLKHAKIAPDRAELGSFQDVEQRTEGQVLAILHGLESSPRAALSADERRVLDLYEAFEDSAQIERRGLAPVRADLNELAGLRTDADVARAMGSARLQTAGLYDPAIGINDEHPNAYVVDLEQAGLGLPDRDYYLVQSPALKTVRAAYRRYLATMLGLIGDAHAQSRADAVFDLERRMARVEWSDAQSRQEALTYNPMTLAGLERLAPQFPWRVFFDAMQLPLHGPDGSRRLIVVQKGAFEPLAQIFVSTPVRVWRDYLTAHFLHTYAMELPARFRRADFGFFGTVLTGSTQPVDRRALAVQVLDDTLGQALGRLYVRDYFPPETETKAEALVASLIAAYRRDLQTLTWMSPATRREALAKLQRLVPMVGYPRHWPDEAGLQIRRDDLIGDLQRVGLFEWHRELRRLDHPVDRAEWLITPQSVDAYYDPSLNEIVVPAAILQPPFFDPNADAAVNYGGIGAVIGHEISHGYDDQGSKFDASGAYRDWWSARDRARFDRRTALLVGQYDRYQPLPGLHIRGDVTLGENIADLTGLSMALKAYHLSYGPGPVIDGFTADQRLFLAYAQVWRTKERTGVLREQLLSDVHSPPQYRVIGTTRNIDAWYRAFDVTPSDRYYLPPAERVRLW